jgi:hypothetical protein
MLAGRVLAPGYRTALLISWPGIPTLSRLRRQSREACGEPPRSAPPLGISLSPKHSQAVRSDADECDRPQRRGSCATSGARGDREMLTVRRAQGDVRVGFLSSASTARSSGASVPVLVRRIIEFEDTLSFPTPG